MTEQEHKAALARIEELMGARRFTSRGWELDRLVQAVDQYETETCPIDPPDPAEAAKFRREQEAR